MNTSTNSTPPASNTNASNTTTSELNQFAALLDRFFAKVAL
ncbi:MAG: hypothetical protein WAO83_11325 [Fuerstiella sp.]